MPFLYASRVKASPQESKHKHQMVNFSQIALAALTENDAIKVARLAEWVKQQALSKQRLISSANASISNWVHFKVSQ